MNFQTQPELKVDKSPLPLPSQEKVTENLTKPAVSRENAVLDIVLPLLPGVTQEQFRKMYETAMCMLKDINPKYQRTYRYLTVGAPAPDNVVQVTYHTTIPVYENGIYNSPGRLVAGVYHNFPGINKQFPGLLVSNRGLLIGDPRGEHNLPLTAHKP